MQKAPTGIAGLDEVTLGGLPQGRSTLVCGGPGSGKTLLATSFLVYGALDHEEPGVLISLDERIQDLDINSQSLGFNLSDLRQRNLLAMDFVHLDRNELEESGTYDLEGLFIRLELAVRTVGAKRVVLDTIDTLFGGVPNVGIVRSELRRLLSWLKDKELTTIITAERGENGFTRHGVEEYISDCVIFLDHRVKEEISTRWLRVVKYRGTGHGSNEFPFLIGQDGISVLPVTSLGLTHEASTERVSTGIVGLDEMLEGKGYYKGSSVLISGGPGCGKTSLAAHFVDSICARGESCLFFSFEEAPQQLIRNMRSIDIELQPWIDQGLLRCHSARPSEHGLEMHLSVMHREIRERKPTAVVVDPISALLTGGELGHARIMVLRMVDYLKSIGATTLFLNLQARPEFLHTELDVSSLMDTWLLMRTLPEARNDQRNVQIIKSRGMAHPLQPQPMEITARGVRVNLRGEPG